MKQLTRIPLKKLDAAMKKVRVKYGEQVTLKSIAELVLGASDAQLAHSQKELEAILRTIGEWLEQEVYNGSELFEEGVEALKQGKLPEGIKEGE